MKKIEVFSDGSATSEGKPGGYGWVLVVDGEKVNQGSGYLESASNNDSELAASIHALNAVMVYCLKECSIEFGAPFPTNSYDITLVSDSKLILGWASGEYKFKQTNKIDQYNILKRMMEVSQAKTRWVKGHSGDPFNTLCDKLANNARLKLSNEIEAVEKKANGESLIGKRKTGIICLYYKNSLKIVDLQNGIVESYNRELHGSRGGIFEVREEKSR